MRSHLSLIAFVISFLLVSVTSFAPRKNRYSTSDNTDKHRRSDGRIYPFSRVWKTSFPYELGASSKLAEEILWPMTTFFADMVDQSSGRFYYLCFPSKGEKEKRCVPIRDMAAIWDATKALQFLRERNVNIMERSSCDILSNAIRESIQAYNSFYQPIANGVALSKEVLLEKPNIAHSAMMILACAGAMRLSLLDNSLDSIPPIEKLTRGILSSQLPNGSFLPEFIGSEDDMYREIEFIPGEAMVALMEIHDLSTNMDGLISSETRKDIKSSMMKAFEYYSGYYYERDVGINYNIWQIQAFAKLHSSLSLQSPENSDKLSSIRSYVLDLCDDIIDSKGWKHELSRGQSFYPNLHTVEIACGLDSLVDGLGVVRSLADDPESRALRYEINIKNALYFLEWAQKRVPVESPAGYGGLGYGGVQVFEQRLDVTGHAISALTKILRV